MASLLSRNQNFEVRHLAGFVRVELSESVEYRTYFFSASQPWPAEGICFTSVITKTVILET